MTERRGLRGRTPGRFSLLAYERAPLLLLRRRATMALRRWQLIAAFIFPRCLPILSR